MIDRRLQSQPRQRGTAGRALARLALAALLPSAAGAATFVADPGRAADCPCGTKEPACGTPERPDSCLADALARAGPGDEVVARDGVYPECLTLARGGTEGNTITVRSEHPGGAQITPPGGCGQAAVTLLGSHILLSGFRVVGPRDGDQMFGVRLAGSSDILSDCEIARHMRGVLVEPGAEDDRLVRLDIHHNHPREGIKLDGGAGLLVDACRIHHNDGIGILEGGRSERLHVRASEIDDNGVIDEHGFYLKGSGGWIEGNRVHHNAGYGIQLWAAPIGTAAHPYRVESNDVFLNGRRQSLPRTCARPDDRWVALYGGGVVLGGNKSETGIPGDPTRGLPRFVEIRRNLVHHNIGLGFAYRVDGCDSADSDNTFHDNVVSRNGAEQILLVAAAGTHLVLRRNLVLAGAGQGPEPPALVRAIASRLAEGAFDGNIYDAPGQGAGAPRFLWNTHPYSYEALQAGGVLQDGSCGDAAGTDSEKAHVDRRSRFRRPGARELAAATAGIPIRVGEGREPDPWEDSFLAGAGTGCGGTDPRVFPGAQEICDGVLDDRPPDCSASAVPADEVDADRDGFFACRGRCDVRLCDCDDSDCEVHPGASERCNGRDDNCNGEVDEGCPPPKKP